MNWDASRIPNLQLQATTALVTGANSGLGFHSVLELARKGARVLLACRSEARARAAIERIVEEVPHARLEVVELDLASLESVRRCAESVVERERKLDLLVNNAGVMAIPYRKTADGFEMQFGTNHLGHFALTGRLFALLRETPESRVVTVSSMAHTFGRIDFDDLHGDRKYRRWGAYGQSKLANVLFGYELARRVGDRSPISAVAHPGYADTNLQLVAPQMDGSAFLKAVMRFANATFAQSAARGALPTLYAATEPGVQSGDFIGPDGYRQMRGYPKRCRSSRLSRDPELARRLWDYSAEVTGVDFGGI